MPAWPKIMSVNLGDHLLTLVEDMGFNDSVLFCS